MLVNDAQFLFNTDLLIETKIVVLNRQEHSQGERNLDDRTMKLVHVLSYCMSDGNLLVIDNTYRFHLVEFLLLYKINSNDKHSQVLFCVVFEHSTSELQGKKLSPNHHC